MFFKSIAAAACLAVASHAAADGLSDMRMSVRELFGVIAVRDQPGYQPSQAFCGMGLTCADACGAGYEMCPSSDESIHCYNPTASQVCCPGGAGTSCDPGYFCASGPAGEQLCCKEGTSLADCAAAKGIAGALTSQAPLPTSASSTSSTSSSSSTSSTMSSSSTSESTSTSVNATLIVTTNSTSSWTKPTASVTSTYGFNSTVTTRTPIPPTITSTATSTSSSSVPTSGAGSILVSAASAFVALAAGCAALL